MTAVDYRGRIAPSPTGFLHAGHALTFWCAQQRAREHGGKLILRIEDLDTARCRPEFVKALFDDLRWFGLSWDEGPDVGGAFGPYVQTDRRTLYFAAREELRLGGFVYPCTCSRRDVASSAAAPHDENEEPMYPGTCRPGEGVISPAGIATANWRFRVPDGEQLEFTDGRAGPRRATAGKDFGDFVVWRKDDTPAYQLAVVVDDAAMQISEAVRGADLLMSTFRQLLLYRALRLESPRFYHTALVADANGKRLAKRDEALSLRVLRERGRRPAEIREELFQSQAAAPRGSAGAS